MNAFWIVVPGGTGRLTVLPMQNYEKNVELTRGSIDLQ